MKLVETHGWTRDAAEMFEVTEGVISDKLEDLPIAKNQSETLLRLSAAGVDLASFAATIPSASTRVVRGLRIAAEACAFGFELSEHAGTPIEATVEGRPYRLSVARSPSLAGPRAWLAGFYAACAVRDHVALKKLGDVSRSLVNAAQFSGTSRFQLDFVRALQELEHRGPLTSAILATTETKAAAERVSLNESGAFELCTWEIKLAGYLSDGDATRFNEVLEATLLAHRSFWTRAPRKDDFTDDRREHPQGFLALPALGLSCLAHDRGIPIEIESPYIPAWVVKHEW